MRLPQSAGGLDEEMLVAERYRLLAPLGRGAFGVVWRAHDERLRREVAIKVLPRDGLDEQRFVREARAAARLSHPGVVTLYEATADDEAAYLVSELVQGTTLSRLLARGLLSDHDAAAIGLALAGALQHAHAHGVVHRDIKPANILVPDRPLSAAGAAKLTDFGVARLFEGDVLTRTGDVVGTAAYMAPEQAMGEEAGPEADVYSLALVLREALTGTNPRREDRAARGGWPRLEPLRRVRPDLPGPLTSTLDAALDPLPGRRPSLTELRDVLAAALPGLSDRLDPEEQAPEQLRSGERVEERLPRRARTDERTRREGWPEERTRREGWPEERTRREGWPEERRAGANWAGEPELPLAPRRRARTFALSAPAACVTGASVAWLAPRLTGTNGPATWLAAAIAALLFLVLPRLTWCAAAAGLATAAVGTHHAGALVWLSAMMAAPVILLPLRARSWSLPLLPAVAILAGAGGLAGAWPALAGRARGPLTRAGLGACGWLAVCAVLAWRGGAGYLPHPHGVLDPAAWTPSLHSATRGMLVPLVRSGALLGAPVWAAAALVMPWLIRGRLLVLDAVAATVWTTVTVSATGAVLAATGRFPAFAASDPALIGAVAAGLLALAPTLVTAWREGGGDPELP